MKVIIVIVLVILVLGMTRNPDQAAGMGDGLGRAAVALGDALSRFLGSLAAHAPAGPAPAPSA